ncbi:MAG: DEAD/DEAH box helicase [Patescibacteria group bacterium]
MTNPTGATPAFSELGIAPKLLEALTARGLSQPTPIQGKAIPVALEGGDIIGIAQTGTGKTLAFSIPMIQRLSKSKGRGLVILPTRELALQVDEELQKIAKHIGLRTAVLIGGQSMKPQMDSLRRNPHVIVATPGRLIDHLDQRTVKLDTVHELVLDEADRMLDMGFEPQIKRVLQSVTSEHQTMLFSATMPPEIVHIANKYMKTPTRVEVAAAGTASSRVAQEMILVPRHDKIRLLEKILGETEGTVLVFSRTKHGASKITRQIKQMNHTAAEIHSDRSLNQRKEALNGFKSGKYRILVATDIAARGIDVKGIELVVNFDLPDNPDDYVHRIGRTGRANHEGKAVSFATPDQIRDVKSIERIIRKEIPRGKLPTDLPAHRATLPNEEKGDFGSVYGRDFSGRATYGRAREQARSYGKSSSYGQRSDSYGARKSYGDKAIVQRSPAFIWRPQAGLRANRRFGKKNDRNKLAC